MYRIKSNGSRAYGVKEYIADTIEDIPTIDITYAASGSHVFVVSKSKHYMLDNNKQWIEIFPGSGSGDGSSGGGGAELPPGIIIRPDGTPNYNGGEYDENGNLIG